ncbi:MAG: hypothetical protein KDB16_03595 [Acidimicrobiales bacterium]|nr:hypothetical protein [Acidimicrobiales bacterium]
MNRRSGGVVRQGAFAIPQPNKPNDVPQAPSGPRTVTQPGIDELSRLDPRFAAQLDERLDQARREGYDRGFAEGMTRASDRIESLSNSISSSATALANLDDRSRRQATEALIDLAIEIATRVMDRTPHDGGQALANRLQLELESLPSGPVTIDANPEDIALLAKALPGGAIVVAADPTLKPGEAKLRGEWVMADMTREAGWKAVRRIIEDACQQG